MYSTQLSCSCLSAHIIWVLLLILSRYGHTWVCLFICFCWFSHTLKKWNLTSFPAIFQSNKTCIRMIMRANNMYLLTTMRSQSEFLPHQILISHTTWYLSQSNCTDTELTNNCAALNIGRPTGKEYQFWRLLTRPGRCLNPDHPVAERAILTTRPRRLSHNLVTLNQHTYCVERGTQIYLRTCVRHCYTV